MAYKIKSYVVTTLPVSLSEAKNHLQVTTTDDDDMITAFIKSAVDYVEKYTNRVLQSKVWELYIDGFPSNNMIYLEKSPVATVDKITYYTTDSEIPTLMEKSKYKVDVSNMPARLTPAYNETWPDTKAEINSVIIEFTAGYTSADSVPNAIRSAIKLIVANIYENRGDEGHRTMPKTIDMLLDPYKVFVFS